MLKVSMNKIFLILALFTVVSCKRGWESKKSPIHPNPNMDNQEKYVAQSSNIFFSDRRSMRDEIAGTIPMNHLKDDKFFYQGLVDKEGKYEESIMLPYDKLKLDASNAQQMQKFLTRGKERYTISCVPCHGQNLDGKGLVAISKRGFNSKPRDFTDQNNKYGVGHIFRVITYGFPIEGDIKTMSAFRYPITEKDRWAIAYYITEQQKKSEGNNE